MSSPKIELFNMFLCGIPYRAFIYSVSVDKSEIISPHDNKPVRDVKIEKGGAVPFNRKFWWENDSSN